MMQWCRKIWNTINVPFVESILNSTEKGKSYLKCPVYMESMTKIMYFFVAHAVAVNDRPSNDQIRVSNACRTGTGMFGLEEISTVPGLFSLNIYLPYFELDANFDLLVSRVQHIHRHSIWHASRVFMPCAQSTCELSPNKYMYQPKGV